MSAPFQVLYSGFEKVSAVVLQDGTRVEGINLQGTSMRVSLFCSQAVKARWLEFGMDIVGGHDMRQFEYMAIAAAKLFTKYYQPGSSWPMDENQVAWDAAVNNVLNELNELTMPLRIQVGGI
jgi:hypothetical protein